jgi:hydrogenase maturation protein HypF
MSESSAIPTFALRVMVRGHVQGIGFRPAMARLATSLSLAADIRNTRGGVEIVVEGSSAAVTQLLKQIPKHAPEAASIADIRSEHCQATGRNGIVVAQGDSLGPIEAQPPLDRVVCAKCLAEVASSMGRRSGYAFTSCAQCGPRYSILDSLPYDRRTTAMSRFALCAACQLEFETPADRRYHAETIACPRCGPVCSFTRIDPQADDLAQDPIESVRSMIRAGGIVAVKGLGGYQLILDATNSAAVRRLRQLKHRSVKPLAILVDCCDTAARLFDMSETERAQLTSPSGAIVLLNPRREIPSPLAQEIAPGLREVGVMLPTTPLHYLLAQGLPPLVATSGNGEGFPIAFSDAAAHQQLAEIGDGFLDHNRPIRRPIDDSVVRVIGDRPVTLRLARGFAPLALDLEPIARCACEAHVLAVGGQQNNAIAIWNGRQAVLGPYVGDLDSVAACERWLEHREYFCRLLAATPSFVAYDLHPEYYTTRWAANSHLRMFGIQHHHAHVVAAMIEHQLLDREVLGIAWDGTGMGIDGQLWGGEFLRVTAGSFTQIGHLRPFALPGGEAAITSPWRTALSMLSEAIGVEAAVRALVRRGYDRSMVRSVSQILSHPRLMPTSTSMGRLFDVVAVLALSKELLGGGRAQYEGHFAMLLESAISRSEALPAANAYPLPLIPGDNLTMDWRSLVKCVLEDVELGQSASTISAKFHTGLAQGIAEVSDRNPALPIVLGGGVFQNRVLTELTLRLLEPTGRKLAAPGRIPPGDGGLAAGQLAVALANLQSDSA